MKTLLYITFISLILHACGNTKTNPATDNTRDTLALNNNAAGDYLELYFEKGPEHNYPQFAFWLEDAQGNYIQTLYVSESIATGTFKHGQTDKGKWLPGERRRPAALPVWAHKRGVKEADGLYIPTPETRIADAYSGETPLNNFVIRLKTDRKLPQEFVVRMEINQTWDWNEYWTNSKFPDDEEYKTSCQPSLVYEAKINRANTAEVELKAIGHGHYSGKDGSITSDLSTITTALDITKKVSVKIN